MSRRSSRFANWDPATRLLLRQALVGIGVTVFVVLLLVGVWYGTRMSAVTIATVSAHDGPTIDAKAVEQMATAQLEGTYFRLIPRQFAWLYPEQTIAETLLAEERIRTVDLQVVDGTELQITFTEHVPTALWCPEDPAATCFYVDDFGYAFTAAPQLQGGSFMRYVTPDRTPTLGGIVATPTLLADTAWFLEKLDTVLQLYPERVHLYKDGRVTYELSHGGTIMVADRHDPIDTFRYLETLLQSDEYQELAEEEFQYIDLRFGNKLFILKEELAVPETEMASGTAASSTTAVPVESTISSEVAE